MPQWFFVRGSDGTNKTLRDMDYAYMAQPFIRVPASDDSIDLNTLDFAYFGQSFVPFGES